MHLEGLAASRTIREEEFKRCYVKYIHCCYKARASRLDIDMEVKQKQESQRQQKSQDRPSFSSCHVIVNVGGSRNRNSRINLVETFNCETQAWTLWQALPEPRAAASTFLHHGSIFVSGGRNQDGQDCSTIMSLMPNENAEWSNFPANLPIQCSGHATIVYHNRLYVIGGGNRGIVSQTIYKMLLASPYYSSQSVCVMPRPVYFHGCELIGRNIFIVGGSSTSTKTDLLNKVVQFDIITNECTDITPLPFAVGCMGTAKRGVNIIVVGGCNERGEVLKTVFMYNTENGGVIMLPDMREKRRGCSVVMVDNMLVVMGGANEYEYLSSVEVFSFEENCWRNFPSMSQPRAFFASVLVKGGSYAVAGDMTD